MLDIRIQINTRVILRAWCVNQDETNGNGETKYRTNTGEIIWHDPNDGAGELAKKLIDATEDRMRGKITE